MTDIVDPYAYPGSSVLRNKPGFVDAEALAEYEYERSAQRILEIHQHPIPGRLDLKHLQAIHRAIFQDVYDWAGDLRTVGITKGGSRFAQPDYIPAEAAKLSLSMAKEANLQGLEKRPFVDRLAHYYAEWNALHPFREGSGRSTRELMGEIARRAGYALDQTHIDNNRGQWNEAARLSFGGRLQPVAEIFWESVRPSRSVAFETLSRAEALARHPELDGTYRGLAKLEAAYEERLPGDTEQQQKLVEQAKRHIIQTLDGGTVLQTREEPPRAREKGSPER